MSIRAGQGMSAKPTPNYVSGLMNAKRTPNYVSGLTKVTVAGVGGFRY